MTALKGLYSSMCAPPYQPNFKRSLDDVKVLAGAWRNSRLDSQRTEKRTKCDTLRWKSISLQTHSLQSSTAKVTPLSLLAAQRKLDCQDGSLEIPLKGGFTLSTHSCQVRPIQGSEGNAVVQKDALKKSSAGCSFTPCCCRSRSTWTSGPQRRL